MINIRDSVTIARAKLRSKRLLLLATVILSGLLFALLYSADIVTSGITNSAEKYSKAALGGKYLVKSSPIIPSGVYGPNRIDLSKETIQTLTNLQQDYIANQKKLAAQLKISFDEKTIDPVLVPSPYANKSLPVEERVMINAESPVFQLYLEKLQKDYAATARNKLSDLKNAALSYHPQSYHQNILANTSYQTLNFLKNGKEDIAQIGQEQPANNDLSTYGYLTSSVRNSMYSFIDDSLIQRFILPINDRRKAAADTVPVIITVKEAADIFGDQLNLGPEPDGPAEKVAWIKKMQTAINGQTYEACYRNQADRNRITQAAQTLSEIDKNKSNKEYQRPSLIYNLPTQTCGDLTIKEDTRSSAEKAQQLKQDTVAKQLGTYQEPKRQIITFQIVGVMPVTPQAEFQTDLPTFISQLLSAQYGVGAIIPSKLYTSEKSPHSDVLLNAKDNTLYTDALRNAGIGETIIAFSTLNDARSFIKEQGCPNEEKCDKPFALTPYGSNYLLMDELNSTLGRILSYTLLVIIGLAIIIVGFMMMRIIIDSRRETAVFRAIGATRGDIAAIYLIYSVGVALRIVAFSLLLGFGIAYGVQAFFSPTATYYAQASYGIFDTIGQFDLVNYTSPMILLFTLIILVVSIVAVLPPLLRNLRRNPIKDMRDE